MQLIPQAWDVFGVERAVGSTEGRVRGSSAECLALMLVAKFHS